MMDPTLPIDKLIKPCFYSFSFLLFIHKYRGKKHRGKRDVIEKFDSKNFVIIIYILAASQCGRDKHDIVLFLP